VNDETKKAASGETAAPEADESFAWTDATSDGTAPDHEVGTGARERLAQLQEIIENFTEQAGPVLRQVGAKAAELAVVAGEKAGPVAARAAELTAEAGTRIAERSRELAAELRRDQAARAEAARAEAAPSEAAPSETETPTDGGDQA
jgi:hypothetical protein